MEITVLPHKPLVDERLAISIRGLKPRTEVTVKASVTEGKASFSSSACFISDNEGNVYIHQQPSLSGTYTGVDSMGLFWSMTPDPGQKKGLRFVKRDVTTPQLITLSVYAGHHSRNDCCESSNCIISKELQRWFKGKSVTREEIRHGNLRGTLFIPQGPGPFPGVIDMFGSAGGLMEMRASLFASRGFVSYSLAYFGFDDLPQVVTDISFKYLKDSVDWFSTHKMVRKEGIGICGVSKGGEFALMLSTACPQIKAVVNINGPPFCSYGPMYPFTDYVEMDFSKIETTDDGFCMRNALEDDFTPNKILKTWKSNAKILYIVGEDDQSVHPKFAQELYNCYPDDKRDHLIIKRYPNAGHLIEPPYNPVCLSSYQHSFEMYFVWGGKMKEHMQAEEDSWQTILDFFKTILVSKDTFNSIKSHL